MSPDEYYAAIRRLGLTRTNVPTVFRDLDGLARNVPDPAPLSPEQRQEYTDLLRFLILGVGPSPLDP